MLQMCCVRPLMNKPPESPPDMLCVGFHGCSIPKGGSVGCVPQESTLQFNLLLPGLDVHRGDDAGSARSARSAQGSSPKPR